MTRLPSLIVIVLIYKVINHAHSYNELILKDSVSPRINEESHVHEAQIHLGAGNLVHYIKNI